MQTVALPTEDEVYRMTKLTEQVLAEAGYVHYEVSNFAKPGYACRHNIGYWERENYLGLGLGASSLMENIRYSNTRNCMCIWKKTRHIREGIWENEITDSQGAAHPAGWNSFRPRICMLRQSALHEKGQMEEFMFLGLRMMEGISRNVLHRRLEHRLRQCIRRCCCILRRKDCSKNARGGFI